MRLLAAGAGPVAAAVCGVQVLAVGAAWLLRRRERLLMRTLPYLVSVAVGVLLATALLHLLPESIEQLGNGRVVPWLVGGTILVLFSMERLVFATTGAVPEQPEAEALLRAHVATSHTSGQMAGHAGHHHHHHGEPCPGGADMHGGRSSRPGNLLMASMLHSLVDGATIAAAFSAGARTGWLAATAVALHEVPHRMGDLALLVQLRVRPERALRFAMLAGLPALLGMALVLLGGARQGAVRYLLPISAGSFLYVALVNLLPEVQVECRRGRVLVQLLCLLGGVALVGLVGLLPER